MKKIILIGLFTLFLLGFVIAAKEFSENEETFLSNVPSDIMSEVTKMMKTMTPEEALELRIKQIAEESKKSE